MFVRPHASEKGSSKGSVAPLVYYLDKENRGKPPEEHEWSFNDKEDRVSNYRVIKSIDANKQGLRKTDDKHFMVSISFSKKELEGKSDKELKDFVKIHFAKNYAKSVLGRNVDPNTLVWYAKLEHDRTYKNMDNEVKEGRAEVGQKKPGDQRHIHVMIARKTTDNKSISPMSSNKGSTKSKAAVKSGFDRVALKENMESSFDEHFEYDRAIDESFSFSNTIKNGTARERVAMKSLRDRFESKRDLSKITSTERVAQQPVIGIKKIAAQAGRGENVTKKGRSNQRERDNEKDR